MFNLRAEHRDESANIFNISQDTINEVNELIANIKGDFHHSSANLIEKVLLKCGWTKKGYELYHPEFGEAFCYCKVGQFGSAFYFMISYHDLVENWYKKVTRECYFRYVSAYSLFHYNEGNDVECALMGLAIIMEEYRLKTSK